MNEICTIYFNLSKLFLFILIILFLSIYILLHIFNAISAPRCNAFILCKALWIVLYMKCAIQINLILTLTLTTCHWIMTSPWAKVSQRIFFSSTWRILWLMRLVVRKYGNHKTKHSKLCKKLLCTYAHTHTHRHTQTHTHTLACHNTNIVRVVLTESHLTVEKESGLMTWDASIRS